MVVRIQGTGQYRIDQATQDELNALDNQIVAAVDRNDVPAAHTLLIQAATLVQERGVELAPDDLSPSDLILPDADAPLEEIHELIPG